jgi:hypothetical protein
MNAATIGRFIVGYDYASGELAPTSTTVTTFEEIANCVRSIRSKLPRRRGPASWFAKSDRPDDHFRCSAVAAIKVIARMSAMNGI